MQSGRIRSRVADAAHSERPGYSAGQNIMAKAPIRGEIARRDIALARLAVTIACQNSGKCPASE